MNLFESSLQRVQQTVIQNKLNKVRCLFLLNSGSLDEFIYRVFYQQMTFEQASDFLKSSHGLTQIVSSQIKGLKKKSQFTEDKVKQQQLSRSHLESNIQQNLDNEASQNNKQKSYNDQITEQTKRNLLDQFNNICYRTPQNVLSVKAMNNVLPVNQQTKDHSSNSYIELDMFNFQEKESSTNFKIEAKKSENMNRQIKISKEISTKCKTMLSSFEQIEQFYSSEYCYQNNIQNQEQTMHSQAQQQVKAGFMNMEIEEQSEDVRKCNIQSIIFKESAFQMFL